MIRLIALDLDGTVFDEHKHISERNKNTVRKAASHGVFIVPVTGRPLRAIPSEIFDMAPIRYVAATSGACIFDADKGEVIHRDLISQKTAIRIINKVRETPYVPMVYVDGTGYAEAEDLNRAIGYAMSEAVKKYLIENRVVTPNLMDLVLSKNEGLEKITVNFPRRETGELEGIEEVLEVLYEFNSETDMVYGGAINLEITNRTATKGNALRFLGKHLGIKKEEIMAIGDSGNDEEMLKEAGIAVAMANGTENVKNVASFVTKSNEEDGVAFAIEKFL